MENNRISSDQDSVYVADKDEKRPLLPDKGLLQNWAEVQ